MTNNKQHEIKVSRQVAIDTLKAAKTYRQKQSALKIARSSDMAVNVPLNSKEELLTTEIARLIAGYEPILQAETKASTMADAVAAVRSDNEGVICCNTDMPCVWDDSRAVAEKAWQVAQSAASGGITFKQEKEWFTTYAGDAARAIGLLKLPADIRDGVLIAKFPKCDLKYILSRASAIGYTLNIIQD